MTSIAEASNTSSLGALQLVPETILKKKHDLDELRAQRASHLLMHPKNRHLRGQKQNNSSSSDKVFKPETILASARSRRNHAIRWKRVAKKGMQARASNKKLLVTKIRENVTTLGSLDTPETYATNSVGAKLIFCVRVRDAFGMPAQVKKTLSKFGLRNVYEGVFLRYDIETRKTLHLIEPWVLYGPPSKALVLDLIQRRGHAKIDGQKIPLTDNTVIEKALGQEGEILCVQDLVEELHTVGKNFHRVQRFLWPFQLEPLRTKYQRNKLNLKEGGDYGDRGELMDEIVRGIL